MRQEVNRKLNQDPRINYRGKEASRVDNLTDAVFGIAITLLIFNLSNPNSFNDLITFTKTLPAFLISIAFVILIWTEHLRFSAIYSMDDSILLLLNTLFIALVIFYVYPLRFMMLFLTNYFFGTNINIKILGNQVPDLLIYYGLVAFALYFLMFLFYQRAIHLKEKLALDAYEVIHTRFQKIRLVIMFSVPLVSISLVLAIRPFSHIWASVIAGNAYWLYYPAMMIYGKKFKKASENFDKDQQVKGHG